MKLSDDTIDRLQSSVSRLVEANRKLESDNRRLVKRDKQQSEQLTQLQEDLKQNQERLNEITLSSSIIEVSGGPKAARLRVNSLLRDIDRCLALVNK